MSRGLDNYSVPPWQSNLQLHPQDRAPASPPLDSDSEYYTDATQGVCEADNTSTKGSDTEEESIDQLEVQHANVRQADVQNASVGVTPVRFTKRGLRSQITLGEDII